MAFSSSSQSLTAHGAARRRRAFRSFFRLVWLRGGLSHPSAFLTGGGGRCVGWSSLLTALGAGAGGPFRILTICYIAVYMPRGYATEGVVPVIRSSVIWSLTILDHRGRKSSIIYKIYINIYFIYYRGIPPFFLNDLMTDDLMTAFPFSACFVPVCFPWGECECAPRPCPCAGACGGAGCRCRSENYRKKI